MSDLDRRGFITAMLAGLSTPSALFRRRAKDVAELPPYLAANVGGEDEIVAYDAAVHTRHAAVVSVKRDPLRIEKGHGVKFLARGPNGQVLVYLADELVAGKAFCFVVPTGEYKDTAVMYVSDLNPRCLGVGGVRVLDGSPVWADFDLMILLSG